MLREARFIKEFTPNWFAAIMGNGGVALVINYFSATIPFLWYIAACLWGINIILFILFITLFIMRFCYYPQHFLLLLKHHTQPLFLGCIPMALITIVNGFLAFGIPMFGHICASYIAIVCWWIDVALSLMVAWIVPFAMFLLQEHTLESMTPVWLLPIVACEVAAASGGLCIPYMHPAIQITALFLCFALWSISVLLAFIIITIFFKRLVLHSLPEKSLAPSVWLVLGPIGTGALGLVTLSHASTLIASTLTLHLQPIMNILPGAGLLAAIILWGFGFWWLITAIISTIYEFKKHISFALSWWAFTFPLAVYTLGTLAIAKTTQMLFFEIPGIICTLLLVFFWIVVFIQTIKGVINQSLFSAPCLKEKT
jgi:C4-dicarboxylate transporter/malic acid transport protein